MPKYTVVVTKSAQKQLDKLSDHIAHPILSAISDLAPTKQGVRITSDK